MSSALGKGRGEVRGESGPYSPLTPSKLPFSLVKLRETLRLSWLDFNRVIM